MDDIENFQYPAKIVVSLYDKTNDISLRSVEFDRTDEIQKSELYKILTAMDFVENKNKNVNKNNNK